MWVWVGRGLGALGLGYTYSPSLSVGLTLEYRGIEGRGVQCRITQIPSQKAMTFFSGSPIQSQAHTHLRELSDSRPRRGLACAGAAGREIALDPFLQEGNPQPDNCYPSQAPTWDRERGPGSEETVVRRAGWPEMGQCSFNSPPRLQTRGGGEVAAPGDKRIRISKLCSNLGS